MNLSTILDQIDLGSVVLPEFQRGYVWNRDQVRKLMRSLYRGYPVGSFLMWETSSEEASYRGDGPIAKGTVKLLLDGQQRITSLYGVVRNRPPKFFDGNAQAFLGLHFNLESEEFEFYAPLKMKDNPLWINVSELMQQGVGAFISKLLNIPELQPNIQVYINRLNAIENIRNHQFHIETVTGEDKTVDTVVDIFNEVNSGGTKLSKADLALAKICGAWPEARDEMKIHLAKWSNAGFDFHLDWLMRCITATLSGQAYFTALKDVTPVQFANGLATTEKLVDTLLNLVASRLGLDHTRVLGSPGSFATMARYLHQRGSHLLTVQERDKLLYWYIHTLLWGRYAGSTESTLARDLAALEPIDDALDRLIELLHQNRGDLRLYPRDFEGWSISARFYPLLYLMTRVCQSRDWATGNALTAHLLGKLSSLQVHHIFPQAVLYKRGYTKSQVNAIANFTFLTQETNLLVSDREPIEYLEQFTAIDPELLRSHWIPLQPELWQVENYQDFLSARRELLAEAANQFLDSLLHGTVPETEIVPSVLEREVIQILGGIESEEEEQILQECNGWIVQQGLPPGEYQYELVNEVSGLALVVLDLAWPNGLQPHKSYPVALLMNEEAETLNLVQSRGFLCFSDFDLFKEYVTSEVVGTEAVFL